VPAFEISVCISMEHGPQRWRTWTKLHTNRARFAVAEHIEYLYPSATAFHPRPPTFVGTLTELPDPDGSLTGITMRD
jgi:hypothetical protein